MDGTRFRRLDDGRIMLGNFELPREFACACCGKLDILWEVWWVCQMIRIRFRAPVVVRSGYRCSKRNSEVAGSPHSDHLYGWAADVSVVGELSSEVARYAATLLEVKRVGIYEPGLRNGQYGFCHIGVKDRGPGSWRRWRVNKEGEVVETELTARVIQ